MFSGSLDAGGSAAEGCTMRGTRTFGNTCTSVTSVSQYIFESWQAEP